jgi:hypothetical protein
MEGPKSSLYTRRFDKHAATGIRNYPLEPDAWLGCAAPRGSAAFSPCRGPKKPNQPAVVNRGHVVLKLGRATGVALGIVAVLGVRGSSPAYAEDFDAGKSAAQLFASDCSSCHRTPYGLARRMNSWSLNSFLREHYTASHASADTLSTYLLGVGGGSHSARGKRSELAIPATNHRHRSTLLPPADIPSR